MAEGKIQQAQDTSKRLGRLYELALTVAGNPIEVFDHIVNIIAEVFRVRVAIVEKIEGDKIITLSMYLDGRILHEGVFELAGTPCANVREAATFCSFNAAAERFPRDQFLADYKLESYIGVPVVSSGGEVIAIINAMDGRPIHLTDDDLLFLKAMASRVRLELERTEQATEARVVHTLLDVSKEITRLRTLEESLQLIADHTVELLGVDIAALAMIDDGAGTTTWKALSGFRTDAYLNAKFAPGQGTAGRAIAAKSTVVIEGIGIKPELPAEEFPIHMAEGVTNALGVPMMAGDRTLGVLIAGYRSDRRLSDRQVRVAEALAAQAAVAVENSRLFTELASANNRLLEVDKLKTEMIAELSTPVIPVWDRVLLVPIIGTVDRERSEQMTNSLLSRAADIHAEVVILDITGVRTVDTDAAHHLINTVNSVRVLGSCCIITGIGATVAQTLVRLGINLEEIKTRRRLSDGLQLALDIISAGH